MHRIIIFANGNLPDLSRTRAMLRVDDFIICADGGTRHVLALNINPQLIIGDMDSTEPGQLQQFKDAGVAIELFPRDKNETDLELAIARAVAYQPQQIIIAAGLGGRLDQTLANIALISDEHVAAFDVRLDDGVEECFFCRDQVQVEGRSGDIISLIPWGEPVEEVQTENLRWPLHAETLYPDKTRGISNEMLSDIAAVRIASGRLLVVHSRKS